MRKGAYAKSIAGQGSNRPDRTVFAAQFQANRKIILATQSVCGICGRPVDKSLKSPDPMSATVDHIIPVSKRGDPVSLDNLQLAHRCCNRKKSDNMGVLAEGSPHGTKFNPAPIDNRFFLSVDWKEG